MRALVKRSWYRLFKRPPDEIIDAILPLGKILILVLSPERVELLRRDLVVNERRGLVDRLVKRELTRRFYRSSAREQGEMNRSEIWGSEAGVRWHEAGRRLYSDPVRFEHEYLRRRNAAVGQLRDLCASGSYIELCEIGTGNGLFLDHLSRELPAIERFVGIDLSEEQIERNRVAYADAPLEFLHAEAADYVREHPEGATIFLFAGTLECLTEAELRDLLGVLRSRPAPTALTLIEPVNIDLDREFESQPRGGLLFSHNYPHLLREAGFDVAEVDLRPIEGSGPLAMQVSLTASASPRSGAPSDPRNV